MSGSPDARHRVVDVRGFEVGLAGAELALGEAVEHLRRDGLIAYPTETVYGFGGRCSEPAVSALAALKHRDSTRPFLLLIEGSATVSELAWTPYARALAAAFWPGALTLVLADPEARFPRGVRGATGVAVRQTAHPVASALIRELGEPLTSTSANAPGSPPAADSGGVQEALHELQAPRGRVVIVDAGTLAPSPPSTLVDCTGASPVLVREGAIPLSRLRCVLPDLKAHA